MQVERRCAASPARSPVLLMWRSPIITAQPSAFARHRRRCRVASTARIRISVRHARGRATAPRPVTLPPHFFRPNATTKPRQGSGPAEEQMTHVMRRVRPSGLCPEPATSLQPRVALALRRIGLRTGNSYYYRAAERSVRPTFFYVG